ncbi:MAG: metallophosphoesterase, partial [Pirellulaceae bacterium]
MKTQQPSITQLGRRAFLKTGTLYLAAAGIHSSSVATALAEQDSTRPAVRGGMVTDVHSADRPPGGTRYYRESKKKLAEAVGQFTRDKTDFVIELGDFIDAAPTVEEEMAFLKEINEVYASAPGPKHYVLGNHCVYTLTKEEFLGTVGQPNAYYSFDLGGFHMVVLDACFRSDGVPYGRKNFVWTDPNIPDVELDWLRNDLRQATNKTLLFLHQRLDVGG